MAIERKESKKKLSINDKKELLLLALEGYKMDSDGYNQGGYNWFIQTWGTKWGICNPLLDNDNAEQDLNGDYYLRYAFETAWSPCVSAIEKMSKENPNVTLEYWCDEESGAFRFNQVWKNGECEEEDLAHEIEEERKEREEEERQEEERNKLEGEKNGA
jgi:hypothetical protein